MLLSFTLVIIMKLHGCLLVHLLGLGVERRAVSIPTRMSVDSIWNAEAAGAVAVVRSMLFSTVTAPVMGLEAR